MTVHANTQQKSLKTNNGQHFCRWSRETSSLLYLPSSSFYHRRIRKTDSKLILPSPSLWSGLTKQKRDRRKLFYGRDIISVPWCHCSKSQVSILSRRWNWWCHYRPHLQQSHRRENKSNLSPRCHQGGRGGDKSLVPRKLGMEWL